MESGGISYWLIASIVMILFGLFFLSKSFFHDKSDAPIALDTNDVPEGDLPVVPRQKREPYLEQVAANNQHTQTLDTDMVNSDTNLTDVSLADIALTSNHSYGNLVGDTPNDNNISALGASTAVNEHANVDALGDTLSSLEHATADIMPMVDQKGEATEFDGSSALLDQHLHDQEQKDQISILHEAREVVSVTMLPNSSINFDGQAIVDILDAYGLKFGEMNLYHRYIDPRGNGQLLFSVMRYSDDNQSQPFDIQTLSDETVDGLTFFMPLPHPKPIEAIGGMLSLAGSIARDLNGTIHNDAFEPLTTQSKNALKEYVANYRG